jgi:excinuclease ABC subunit C
MVEDSPLNKASRTRAGREPDRRAGLRANAPELDPAAVVSRLPHRPGVYRMLDRAGNVLYVGKALDLRKRVASYFQKRGTNSPRIEHMLSQVNAVEFTVTRSEGEALLLEHSLIQSLAPRYNILFRDDKSYPYLVLTADRFPRLGFHRGALDPRHRYFGPFPSAGAVRESIHLLQKIFRLRTCEETVFAHRTRPCLLYQIRRCSAPCVGRVEEGRYAEDVQGAALFLSGKEDEVIERLVARMEEASAALRYEEAAVLRDQIAALRQVREKHYVRGEAEEDVDAIACAVVAEVACVGLVMVRGGRHLGGRTFFPRNAEGFGPEHVLEAFLVQHYLEHAVPQTIVVEAPSPSESLERWLSERAGRPVRIVVRATGARRAWLEMARENARIGAEQALGARTTQEKRLVALQQALGLPAVERIECFDVSHTMGEATVAACVVYEGTAMRKDEYRRYNVSVAPGDDYAALREALTRRYRRCVAGEGKLPDLVLIDGGRGQLAVACEVFAELGLADVAVAAVAKGAERRPGAEQILLPQRGDPLVLGRDHPALHLIAQVRDEAHRFAITGHRARRAKARTTSTLEAIEGVGPKRRQRLLARFGGLRALLAASVEELSQVEGVSRRLAERIYRELH